MSNPISMKLVRKLRSIEGAAAARDERSLEEQVQALTRGMHVRVAGMRTNRQLSFTDQPGAPRGVAPPNPFERDAVPMISTPVKAAGGPRS